MLNTKDLAGVAVITRSNQRIGKVASFDINHYTGRIAVMRVKATGIVARLSEDDLLVPWDAILEMTSEHVMIADGAVQAPATAIASSMSPAASPTSLMQG